MDDLIINCQFTASIVDYQDTNTTSTVGEGVVKPGPQTTLVNDWKTLLDIAGLGHCNNATVVTNVEDTILLENRTEHALDDDRRRRVRHEARLLMELLGEEIDSKVAMLTSLSRSGDTNDLARTALNDQQIANADMVAGNGNGVGPSATLNEADALTHALTHARWTTVFFINDNLLTLVTVMVRMEGMKDAIGGSLKSVTNGVVVTFVVVVTHLGSLAVWWIDGGFGFESDFSRSGGTTFVFEIVGWLGTSTIVAFGDIDLCLVRFVLMARRNFDLDLGFGEALVRLLIAGLQREMSVVI